MTRQPLTAEHHKAPQRAGGLFARLMRVVLVGAALASVFLAAPDARAQRLLDSLPELEGVGIVEKRGEQVPPDLVFTNSFGRSVRFGDFFDGERPVIVVMAYYDCPMLCTLVLNQVQRVLNELKWKAGEDFRLVTVSFDHLNTTQQARLKQQEYLLGYKHQVPESAWEFLTGDVQNIRGLAAAIGFHYKFLPESGEFSHTAALTFLDPKGKVHNYLEKLNFSAGEVQLALAEAADGQIGTIFDRIAHFCFRYDPKTGQYTADAFTVMRLGATGAAFALAGFIAYWAWYRRTRLRSAPVQDRSVMPV